MTSRDRNEQELRAWLPRTTLFKRVPDEEDLLAGLADDLVEAATFRRRASGTVLWKRGERARELGILLAGRLDICRSPRPGRRMILRSLWPGAMVGLSCVAGRPHSADVVVGETALVAVLSGSTVERLFARRPKLALRAIAQLGEWIEKLTEERAELTFDVLDERLCRLLRVLSHGQREIRRTHQELADALGVTRPNLSRALKRLERHGLVRRGRGKIELIDVGDD